MRYFPSKADNTLEHAAHQNRPNLPLHTSVYGTPHCGKHAVMEAVYMTRFFYENLFISHRVTVFVEFSLRYSYLLWDNS